MDDFVNHPHVFAGTGFDDPALRLAPLVQPPRRTRPVGLHVHLHNIALAPEFLRLLRRFPVPFDLFLTLTDERACAAARRLFAPALLPAVRDVHVLPVENRGRDVAPWFISLRPFQQRYDLFCHVHGKESAHFSFGNRWRRYLLHHLLHPGRRLRYSGALCRTAAAGLHLSAHFPRTAGGHAPLQHFPGRT